MGESEGGATITRDLLARIDILNLSL